MEHVEIESITPIEDENPPEDVEVADASDNESAEVTESAPVDEVAEEPIEVTATDNEDSVKNTPKVTQQAEALKAALRRAQAQKSSNKTPQPNRPNPQKKASNDKAVDDRRRTMLLGKKATRTIAADNGDVIVAEGAEITEEVLQKAKLANKYIELSMNYKA